MNNDQTNKEQKPGSPEARKPGSQPSQPSAA